MPLEKSASKKAVGHNIEAEMAAGKPHDQAVAIALSTQDRAKHADQGAVVPGPSPVGEPTPSLIPPGTAMANASGNLLIPGDQPGTVKDPTTGRVYDQATGSLIQGVPAAAAPAAVPAPAAPATPAAPGVSYGDLLDPVRRAVGAEQGALSAEEKGIQKGGEAEKAALSTEGTTIAAGGAEKGKVLDAQQKQLADAEQATKDREAAYETQYGKAFADLQGTAIDPQALWKSMGMGSKALSIIGRAMGAFATGYSRGAIPDIAQGIWDHAVEQNIAAQKSNADLKAKSLEFMREHNLDQNQFDNMMRLSLNQQMAKQIDAIDTKNLSDQAQAHLGTLAAGVDTRVAEAKGALAVKSAEAGMGLAQTEANIGMQMSGLGMKPEDRDKAGKLVQAIQEHDRYMQMLANANRMPGVAGVSELNRSGATQQAADMADTLAGDILQARYPDSNRPPPEGELERIKAQLAPPGTSEGRSNNRNAQLHAALLSEGVNRFGPGFTALMRNAQPMAPTTAQGPVTLRSPSGQTHILNDPSQLQTFLSQPGWSVVK